MPLPVEILFWLSLLAVSTAAFLAAWGAYTTVREAREELMTPKDVRELVEEMEYVLSKWTTMRATERQRRKRERDREEQPEAETASDDPPPGDDLKARLWAKVRQAGLLRGSGRPM